MTHKSYSPVVKSVRTFRFRPNPVKSPALLVSLVSCLMLHPVRAAEDKQTMPVSIFCTAYAADLKTVFVKRGGDEYQAVSLSTANIIDAGGVSVEEGRIQLYGPAGDNGDHAVVGSADTAGIAMPLIVLQPATGEEEPAYDAKTLDADKEKFPLGSFSMVNLSPHAVRISHDEKVIELEVSGGQVFKPDHSAGEALSMRMEYKNGENWLLLSSARWASRDDRRTLVCFQMDPSSKRMNIKSVPLRGEISR